MYAFHHTSPGQRPTWATGLIILWVLLVPSIQRPLRIWQRTIYEVIRSLQLSLLISRAALAEKRLQAGNIWPSSHMTGVSSLHLFKIWKHRQPWLRHTRQMLKIDYNQN